MIPSQETSMPRLPKALFAAALALALSGTLSQAVAQTQSSHSLIDEEQIRREPTGGEMVLDALVARPLGLVGTVVGAAVWVVSLPFTLPSRSTERAAKQMVAKPAEFTFKRPLGQFSSCEALPESCGRGR
jgi:hypothetical protein